MRFVSDNAAAAHPKVIEAIAAVEPARYALTTGRMEQAARWRFLGAVRDRGARFLGDDRDRGQLPGARRAVPALSRAFSAIATRISRSTRPARRDSSPAAPSWSCSTAPGAKLTPETRQRLRATASATTCTRSSPRRCRSPTRPNMVSSIAPPRLPRSAQLAKQRGLGFPHGRRAARQCAGDDRRKPGRRHLARGRRRFVVRLRQEWRAQCRSLDPVQDRACRRNRGAPQARRAFAVQGPRCSPRKSWRCWRTACGSTMPAPRTPPRKRWPRPRRRGWSIRSKRMRCSSRSPPSEAAQLRDQGFDFYDWGPGEIRLVTSWDQERANGSPSHAAVTRPTAPSPRL